MKNFVLDLWNDLRDKRLWPVAAVLALGLLAVPLVLSKSAEEPPSAAPAADSSRAAPEPKDATALSAVKLEETADSTGSTLGTFDPSDPFRPPAKIVKRAKAASGEASTSADGPATSGGDTSDSGGAGSGSSGGDTGSTGGGYTGGGGDTGGGDTGGGTTTTQYAYVADVTFRANGNRRTINGLRKLDMLPSQESPLLLFLGVTENGGNAVFLVDSTLSAAGEGKCKPRASQCAFLYLGPGSEHEFTNEDGDSYVLRIDEIRKVEVGAGAAASSGKGKRARAALGAPQAPRRFVLPVLADLVSVSSSDRHQSNRNSDRR